jgi:hypothetical protein
MFIKISTVFVYKIQIRLKLQTTIINYMLKLSMESFVNEKNLVKIFEFNR